MADKPTAFAATELSIMNPPGDYNPAQVQFYVQDTAKLLAWAAEASTPIAPHPMDDPNYIDPNKPALLADSAEPWDAAHQENALFDYNRRFEAEMAERVKAREGHGRKKVVIMVEAEMLPMTINQETGMVSLSANVLTAGVVVTGLK